MNKLSRVGAAVAVIILMPLLAVAQTTGSSSVDVQVQSLLSQITALEQQLKSLVQSVAPTSTPPMWQASSTPPTMNSDSNAMGGCPDFTRDLSLGSQGSDVMQLQQMLSGDGFFSASTTGFFGPLTASALDKFQMQFGISTSSAGFFGPLTRSFVQNQCAGQKGNSSSGSSTPPMMPLSATTPPMWQGTTTPPMHSQIGQWMGTSTTSHPIGPIGPIGTSTPPRRPCPQNAAQGAAAALFVPHVILPAFFLNPCSATSSASQ